MKRFSTWLAMILAAGALAPGSAFAAESAAVVDPALRMGVSLVGLIVAVILLLEALTLRKVALGGAIAERISYVVLAIVCLAGSALAEWVQNFVPVVSQEQIRLAAQLLVIAAMGLLAAYFYSVRRALQGYLRAMTGSDRVADHAATSDDDEDERLA